MTTTQMLLIILVALLTVFMGFVTFIIIRLVRNSSYYYHRILFSNFDRDLKSFYYEVDRFISELEVRHSIKLSEEAKQLIILPLIEFQRKNWQYPYRNNRWEFQYEPDRWRDSIVKIVENITYEPAQFDRNEYEISSYERTSMSVIKAFANKFCNIPPFCGEK